LKATLILFVALILIAAVVLVGLRLVKATRLWPAALLIVTAPLEVYRSSSSAGANLSVFRLALGVAAAAFIVDLVRGRRRFRGDVPVSFAIYGAFVGWQVISALFVTANQSLAHRFIGQYVAGLVAAFLITCYVERRDLRVVAGLCGAAVVLPLLAAVFRVFSVSGGGSGDLPGLTELPLNFTIEAARQSGSFLLDGTQRLNATFSDPNLFGFYAAATFCVLAGGAATALFVEKPIRWQSATSYVMLVGAAAVAVLGTYSRSAWFLAAAGILVLAALLGRSFWTRQRVIAAGVVGVIALGVASPFAVSRLSSSEPGNVKSTQVHEHTLRLALKLAAQHPFVGVGLGGYGRYANEPPIISSAVSTYLTVAAELGFPGLLLLLAAILTTLIAAIKSVLRSPPRERVLLAAFAAAFAGLAVANTVYEAWMDDFQWVLFGLVVALTVQPRLAIGLAAFRRRATIPPVESPSSGSAQAGVVA
jgi:O-Antigen ligase